MIERKSDLKRRCVEYEEAFQFAEANGLKYIEASAKTYQNVDRCFLEPSEDILNKIIKKQINPKNEFGIKSGGE